jgi:hypothetical protein
MKQLLSYFIGLSVFLSCFSTVASTTPTSLESKYFMAATSCYQRQTNVNNPPSTDDVTRWNGALNVYSGDTIECAIPLEHDRDIGSVVISVDNNSGVELRTCNMFVEYSGSNISLGYFEIVPYIYDLEHFRLDNLGSFPRVSSGGHDLIGAVILCATWNPISATKFMRFKSVRVDYN